MRLEADIYTAAGALVGEGPLTSILSASLTRVLDGPGDVRLEVPLGDARVQDLVDNERRMHLYVWQADGTRRLLGIGIPRKLTASVSNGQVTLSLDGPDQLDELRRKNTLLARTYDGSSLDTVIQALAALVTGWTATTSGLPTYDVYARFDGASILKALQELSARYGLHFRWDSNKTIAMGPLGDLASLRITQAGSRMMQPAYDNADVAFIDRLRWVDDTEAVANWIIPLGGGQGEAALTLQHANRAADRTVVATYYGTSNQDQNVTLQGTAPTGQKLGQGIQVPVDTWITHAELYLRKTGSPAGTMTLRVETDSAGAPSGTLVHANATATLAENGLITTAYELKTFTFTGGFYLDASTQYWLVLSTSRSLDTSNYVLWGADGTSPAYAGGNAYAYNGAAWVDQSKDFVFYVWETIDARSDATAAEYTLSHWDRTVALQQSAIYTYADVSYSGATHTASEEYSATYAASKAFDSNLNTQWMTFNDVTGWIKTQFATGTELARVEIYSAGAAAPKNFTIEGSDNNIDWTIVSTVTDQTGWSDDGEWRTFTFSQATYTYWRLNISEINGYSLIYIAEINWMNIASTTYPNKTKLAQSFQVDAACRLTAIDLWLRSHGSPTGNLTVTLQTNSGSAPSGTTITPGTGQSDVVDAATLTNDLAKVTFTFDQPPYCAASTTYWMVLETTGSASAVNYVEWAADGSAPGYTNGEMKYYASASWSAESKDAIFEARAECEINPYSIETTTGPDGSTLYYLRDTDSITAYGQIEKIFKADITPLSHSVADITNAANALYDAAVAWLQRYAVKQTVYEAELVKAYTTLKPGQKIRLTYQGLIEDADGAAVTWRDVDAEFWIVKVTETYTASGVSTTVQLSDVDRAREDMSSLIIGAVEEVRLKNVTLEPYPATFTYVYTDFISGYSVSLGIGANSGGGTVQPGHDAVFTVTIDDSIMDILRVKMRLRTYKPITTVIVDDYDDEVTPGNNATYDLFFVAEGSNYPAGIDYVYIDEVDRAGALGGPWVSDTDDNEQMDEEFDITSYLLDANGFPAYGNHTIRIRSVGRAISGTEDIAVPGFNTWNVAGTAPAPGRIECTIQIHCITQAIKL